MYNTENNKTNMHNYKITISYDGMPYKGWQRLSDNNSIQDILESAVSKYLGTDTTITGSGRTDAGVSAIAQTANFHTCLKLDAENFLRDINSLLPCDITIKTLEPVPLDFHSRKNAVSKTYGYYIALDSKPDVFAAKHTYNPTLPPIMYNCCHAIPENINNCQTASPADINDCCSSIPADINDCRSASPADINNCCSAIPADINNCCSAIHADINNCHSAIPVNMKSMRTAADYLTGTHDFSAFTTDKTPGKSHVRTINYINISFIGTPSGKPILAITVNGSGFLYNMVRIIAGTLLCTGLGNISPKDIPAILQSGVRKNAGPTLPPNGLFLLEVLY